MIYHFWISGMVALFTVIALFATTTPAFDSLSASINTTTFATVSTDDYFHSQVSYISNMWQLWPLVAGIMVFVAVLIGTAQEEDIMRGV